MLLVGLGIVVDVVDDIAEIVTSLKAALLLFVPVVLAFNHTKEPAVLDNLGIGIVNREVFYRANVYIRTGLFHDFLPLQHTYAIIPHNTYVLSKKMTDFQQVNRKKVSLYVRSEKNLHISAAAGLGTGASGKSRR